MSPSVARRLGGLLLYTREGRRTQPLTRQRVREGFCLDIDRRKRRNLWSTRELELHSVSADLKGESLQDLTTSTLVLEEREGPFEESAHGCAVGVLEGLSYEGPDSLR